MEGVDVVATPPHRIVSLGIAHVPENRRLFPQLSVDDNLKMGAFMREARGLYAERLEVVFDLFPRLKERRHQMAGTMSGGEQQMCAIGRALMSNPKLLLLDEPSAGLDPITSAGLDKLILDLRQDLGATFVVVTHELASILAIADRCIMLDRGAYPDAGGVIAEGDPRVLRDTSTHPIVRAFFRRELPAKEAA
jgi:branched-chain amino acid transport system ATP-binding protein